MEAVQSRSGHFFPSLTVYVVWNTETVKLRCSLWFFHFTSPYVK